MVEYWVKVFDVRDANPCNEGDTSPRSQNITGLNSDAVECFLKCYSTYEHVVAKLNLM